MTRVGSTIVAAIPGMYPNATRRNVLLLYLYLVVLLLLLGQIF